MNHINRFAIVFVNVKYIFFNDNKLWHLPILCIFAKTNKNKKNLKIQLVNNHKP